MESVISYLTENPVLGIIAAVLTLSVVTSLLRSLFKVAMTIAVIGLTMVVFFDFQPEEVIDKGTNIVNVGSDFLKSNLIPYLTDRLADEENEVDNKGEQPVVDMNSLVEEYNLDQLLDRLSKEGQLQLEDILQTE